MAMPSEKGLSFKSRMLKRLFDLLVSFLGLICVGWLILFAWIIASFDTRSNGFFLQKRVGREGNLFSVVKIKTMRSRHVDGATITVSGDPRITVSGKFFRKSKIDELPQLFNVFIGQMSFVGPRPDVPGYADLLKNEDRIVLSVRPGITGPASLKYRDEERMLAAHDEPLRFNDEVIFPDKVRINKEYVRDYSFRKDITYIIKTIIY